MLPHPPHPKIQVDAAGTVLLNFGDYGQEIEVACFSGDGARLLTVTEVGVAQIWEIATGAQIGTIRPSSPLVGAPHASPFGTAFELFIEAAALDESGHQALLGLNDGTAGLFGVADGLRRGVFHDPAREPASGWELIRAVTFSPGDGYALVGFAGRTVGIWDTTTLSCHTLLRHPDARRVSSALIGPRDHLVSAVSISPDLRFAFAGYADGTASIWDIGTGSLVLDAFEHEEDILDLFVDSDVLRWITSGGTIWEQRRGDEAPAVRLVQAGEHWGEAAFAPGGREALIRTGAGAVRRWTGAGAVRRWTGGEGLDTLVDAALRPVWGHERLIGFLGGGGFFYPQSKHTLIVASAGGSIALHPPKEPLSTVPYTRLRATPQGTMLAVARWLDAVELWDTATGLLAGVLLAPEEIGALAFSADGALLAVGGGRRAAGARHDIAIWDVAIQQVVHRLTGHGDAVLAVAFGPGARWLASAGLDGSVRIWHLPAGGEDTPTEWRQRRYTDLDHKHLRVLADGRILVFRTGMLEVWRDLDELVCAANIATHASFRMQWRVARDEQSIFGTLSQQGIAQWSLVDGTLLRVFRPDITRPAPFPPHELSKQIEARAGCYLWQGPGGPYAHVGDGPRGWAPPIRLSPDGRHTIIPCTSGAAVLAVTPSPMLKTRVPFVGKMRASAVTAGHVLLVNEKGAIFRSSHDLLP